MASRIKIQRSRHNFYNMISCVPYCSSNLYISCVLQTFHTLFILVDPGDLVVIILASGSEVCRFDPGRGRWIFSERKNPEYDFLWKGSKAVGPLL